MDGTNDHGTPDPQVTPRSTGPRRYSAQCKPKTRLPRVVRRACGRDAVARVRGRPSGTGRPRGRRPAPARQKWNYGRSGARLYAAYRHAGFKRRGGRIVLMNWSWLLLHTPDLIRSPRLRRRRIRYGARLAGFLAGSMERGVRYL